MIRCTRKLLKELRIRDQDLVEVEPGVSGDWFANLIRIERRKCVMFTHAETLYGFLVVGVVRKDFDRFEAFFKARLRQVLIADYYLPEVVDRMIEALGETAIGKTNDRSVLGYMNDFDRMARHDIWYHGGLAVCDPIDLSLDLNRAPLVQKDFFNAEREMLRFMEAFV